MTAAINYLPLDGCSDEWQQWARCGCGDFQKAAIARNDHCQAEPPARPGYGTSDKEDISGNGLSIGSLNNWVGQEAMHRAKKRKSLPVDKTDHEDEYRLPPMGHMLPTLAMAYTMRIDISWRANLL